ncbi:heparan-alpha-glucosaminide N-acetyltransferase domain-containing protein [Allosalinactinospora lopnorensis]|uniref:heparan-alpha-glucosaminide N-acetyltransferase domain-containing protein n=1 Tax=Allosalinactinospora lopnorensis TaxID=1352348 RepID=UPI000623C360|nr:heparan-alpha-glucosaminide N-acetyltransferase domain-containing protein [Allosalinactinospora lopnorensis]
MSNSTNPSPRGGATDEPPLDTAASPSSGRVNGRASANASANGSAAGSAEGAASGRERRGRRHRSPGWWRRRFRAASSGDRLIGIDVARGLAVLGMFVVHVGIGWSLADGGNALLPVVSGRAAALFALLAGVSIALISGGATPKTGGDMGVALWRVVIRGLLMLPLGTLLTMTGVPVAVILAYYAVFFVLAAPLMDERWKIVAGTAAVLGLVGPLVSFYLRGLIQEGPLEGPVAAINSYDPLVAWSGEGIVDFLLTGSYPAITWMPFVLAGLAIGRLDLRSVKVRWALAGVGTAVAALSYTGSWFALNAFGGRERLDSSFDAGYMADQGGAETLDATLREGVAGTVPLNDWAWLLTAAPHSGSPFEVYGAGGVAIAVLGVALLVSHYLRWALYPLASVGALALTTYVGHVLLIWVGEEGWLAGTPLRFVTDNMDWSVLLGALLFATAWRLLVRRRGPLEGPLHGVSMWAAKKIP